MAVWEFFSVSIPLRYAKNSYYHCICSHRSCVSIPLRYAKNGPAP